MEMTDALRPSDVVHRSIRGAVSLGGGQVAGQILNICGSLLLARILAPEDFGLVAILTFFLSLLTALGDLGLSMSLVRHLTEPSDDEYRGVSSFQQVVALGIALTALAATPWVARSYRLASDDWWLLPAMTVAIVADSFRFLPLTRLERRLAFERVGAVEVVQAIVFNATLISLALMGFRAASFAIAVMVRSVTGAAVAIAIGPHLSGWRWSLTNATRFLRFGLPYQGVHFITVLKNSIVPVFIGLLLGTAAVGHLAWAAMVAGFPQTGLILLQRLYVGSFGRLQDHPDELRQFVNHVVWVAHAVVAPLAVLTLVLIDPIVRLVFGDPWIGSIPLVFWMWLGCLVIPTLAPLTGLLHAMGQSRVVFRATLIGTVATWVVGVPLALMLGEVGVAMASLLVHVAGVAIWAAARRAVGLRVLGPVLTIWGCAALAGLAGWAMHRAHPIGTIPQILLYGGASMLVYVAALVGVSVLAYRSGGALEPYGWNQLIRAVRDTRGSV